MLDTLITSKTRIKLITKFFLNKDSNSYLRNLESEFNESTNAIRHELNKFEKAGLLKSYSEGNKKMFHANTEHPLFSDIRSILLKHLGFDHIIEKVIHKLGDVLSVFIVGDFANGLDSNVIELIFVGESINSKYLSELIEKAEEMIKKEIRYRIFSFSEYDDFNKEVKDIKSLLLWSNDNIDKV